MKNKLTYYLLIIFVINLIQSYFTPLMGDEVYYWVYSQDLDFGYFDHPPLVAFIIKMSDFLFSNELSIRFFTVVLNTLTAFFIWKLIPKKNQNTAYAKEIFLALFLLIPGLSIYGFITTPDVPLIFCFALYLWSFQYLEKHNNLLSALFVGVCAALLIYSKYHGAILILLSIITHWKILNKKYYYLAGIIALVLVSPHIYWQYTNDFVSFDYHLFQRAKGAVGISNVFDYLGGSLGILNTFLVLFALFFISKKDYTLSENLGFYKNLFFGIFIFFFLYSFRSKVEAQWVVTASIPLLIVIHDLLVNYWKKLYKWKYLGFALLTILFAVRLLIMLPIDSGTEFHHHEKAYFDEISRRAKDTKVVFGNSYRDAAKYKFYTGKEAMAWSNYHYRKSQFDIGNYDELFHNELVFFVGYTENAKKGYFSADGNDVKFAYLENFPVYNKVNAKVLNDNLKFKQTENLIKVSIENKHNYSFDFKENKNDFKLQVLLKDEVNEFFFPLNFSEETLATKSSYNINSSIDLESIPKGKYTLMLTMRSKHSLPVRLSSNYEVEVF